MSKDKSLDPKKFPVKIGNIIGDLITQWAGKAHYQEVMMSQIWGKIAGENIAKHSHPIRLYNQKLIVAVENSQWMNELTYLKEKIKMNAKNIASTHGIVIADIAFKLGDFKKKTESASHVPPPGK